MTTFSLKLPEALLRALGEEAKARSVAKSAIVRECLEQALRRRKRGKPRVTCLDLMADKVGSFRGPRDLSTNRRHLVKAINANANRAGKNSR
jgi:Ribbon-helix-helix protein, copG family